MKMNKLKLAGAIALVLAAGTASALDVVQTAVTKAVAVNSVAANLKGLSSGAATSTHVITGANTGDVVLKLNDTLVFTVSGAKFDRAALGATPVGLVTSVAGNPINPVASWVLDSTDTILTGTITTADGGDTAPSVVTATLTGKYDLTGVAAGTSVTLNATVSGSVLGATQVIHKSVLADKEVLNTVNSFQKFATIAATTATATVATSFVELGVKTNVTKTAVTTPVTTGIPTTSITDVVVPTGTLLVKLTGVPANATKVDWAVTGITQSDATGLAAPATATTAGDFWLDGAGNAYAKLANGDTKAAITTKAFVVTIDGTASILPASTQMEVSYLAGTSDTYVAHQVLAPTAVASIIRNGSAFSVNSAGGANVIKITDMSGSLTSTTGKITVTGFDAAGASVAGSISIPSLASNSTEVVLMSDVKAALPGGVRYDFVVESTEIIASNVKKTADGITVTTYRNEAGTVTGGTTTKAGNGAL